MMGGCPGLWPCVNLLPCTPNEGMIVMARVKASVIAAGVALASGGLGGAGALPSEARLPPPAPLADEFGGWYLRGDVGAGINATSVDLQNDPDPIAAGVSSGFLSS